MLFTTDKTKEEFAVLYDQFGDSFTEKATRDSLKYYLEQVREQEEEFQLGQASIAEFESKHYPNR